MDELALMLVQLDPIDSNGGQSRRELLLSGQGLRGTRRFKNSDQMQWLLRKAALVGGGDVIESPASRSAEKDGQD